MKKTNLIFSTFLVALLLVATQGCKKDWLDINTDPNNPAVVDVKSVLPSTELAIAHTIGNNFQVFGGIWGQFWTQSPSASQYKTLEQYNPSASDYDRPWRILYADALTDLRYIQKTASAQGLKQYVAIAKLLEAYSFQLLTDNFGDIPYTEALRAEEGLVSPHYDTQKTVYDGIIQTAKDGVALCDESDPVHPGVDDLIYNGDMTLWRKFGNTLLLRMYLRLSEVEPATAQAGIANLEANGAVFLEEGESAKINYTSTGGNTHPYYSVLVEIGGTQNLVASATAVDYMLANNDTLRLHVFYAPATNDSMVGIPQGAYTLPASTPVSTPNKYTGAFFDNDSSKLASVYLLTDYESYFLQAEASARGWLTGAGSAASLYYEGITASFVATGFDNPGDTLVYDKNTGDLFYISEPGVVYPTGGTVQDQIKAIITQKWIAMDGTQGDEAWIEWRRTNYPDFFTPSVNSIQGPGVWPYRLYYPSSEVTRNTNFPGQKNINDKVWWDVN